jgi:hypothetical protein
MAATKTRAARALTGLGGGYPDKLLHDSKARLPTKEMKERVASPALDGRSVFGREKDISDNENRRFVAGEPD